MVGRLNLTQFHSQVDSLEIWEQKFKKEKHFRHDKSSFIIQRAGLENWSHQGKLQNRGMKKIHLCDSDAAGGLPSADSAQPALVIYNAVGHTHLAAEGGQEQHQLDKQQLPPSWSSKRKI